MLFQQIWVFAEDGKMSLHCMFQCNKTDQEVSLTTELGIWPLKFAEDHTHFCWRIKFSLKLRYMKFSRILLVQIGQVNPVIVKITPGIQKLVKPPWWSISRDFNRMQGLSQHGDIFQTETYYCEWPWSRHAHSYTCTQSDLWFIYLETLGQHRLQNCHYHRHHHHHGYQYLNKRK